MLFNIYILTDRVKKIENTLKKTTNLENFELFKKSILTNMYDISLCIQECCYFSIQKFIVNNLYSEILNTISTIENFHIEKDFQNTIDNITLTIKNIYEFIDYIKSEGEEVLDTYNLSYFYPNCYNSLDIEYSICSKIRNSMQVSKKSKINILNYNGLDGKPLKHLTNDSDTNINTFLVYEDNTLKREYIKSFTKAIKNSMSLSIQNEAFDFTISKINISHLLNDNMTFNRIYKLEKKQLDNIYNYTRKNGYVLIAFPYFRLYEDICSNISKCYKDIQVFTNSIDKKEFAYIYILGKKRNQKLREKDEEIYNKLRCFYNKANLYENAYMNVEFQKLIFNDTNIDIKIFKSAILSQDNLLEITESTNVMNSFFESLKNKTDGMKDLKPLLPFNIGQIGLILTSGCLDGIIDEGDGCFHLVKGRVAKKIDTYTSTEGEIMKISRNKKEQTIETTSITSNRVEIKLVFPDGEIKTLV